MKVLILAGGLGTRLSEETDKLPKPMVEIGNRPILWHIMKIYSAQGFNEFVILLGYKSSVVKDYFLRYQHYESDITVDMANNSIVEHNYLAEPWKVTLVNTGIHTMTGGRILRAREFVGSEPFMLTYGDGVCDVDIGALLETHQRHGRIATMTSVQPDGRFGGVEVGHNNRVEHFSEKPKGDGVWINGGFFVCQPEIFDYLQGGDDLVFEQQPLRSLARDGQLYTYQHPGFWKCMDTVRDRMDLTRLWQSGLAPWKIW